MKGIKFGVIKQGWTGAEFLFPINETTQFMNRVIAENQQQKD